MQKLSLSPFIQSELQRPSRMKTHQAVFMEAMEATELSRRPSSVLILFSLLIAFTLGFLASPLAFSRDGTSSSSDCHLQACSNNVTTIVHDDGFVTQLVPLPDDLVRFHTSCRLPPLVGDAVTARSAVIDGLFDGRSPFEAFPPAHIGRFLKRRPLVKGWGSNHPVFERLVREARPRIVVELGSFLGASAIHMAGLIRRQRNDDEFVIFCLDDFRGWPGFRFAFPDIAQEHGNVMLFNQFLYNVVKANASNNILPLPFSTNGGLYKLCELGITADLVEVDAGHDFHSAWADINLGWSLMRPDGKSIMFGHDYFNGNDYHGVRRAVDLFAKLKGLRVEPDGQHWIYRPLPALP